MEEMKFYIRHVDNFLQDKLLLVLKSDGAKEFFQNVIPNASFEEITFQEAEYAVRIGINGKVITYGYTHMLTKEEMSELSTLDWGHTTKLLAEGNERLYKKAMNDRKVSDDE